MSASQLQEVVDRTRRVETRLTKLIIALGFETGARKPVWDAEHHSIVVPNASTSLADCIDVFPAELGDLDAAPVVHEGRLLGYLMRP
jgi:hypothetical protein